MHAPLNYDVMCLKENNMPNHKWTIEDDFMILFIHKFGIESSPLDKEGIAKEIGVSLGSVSYRIGNFKAIDGIGKATHFAKLSFEVHKKYSSLSKQELKRLAFLMFLSANQHITNHSSATVILPVCFLTQRSAAA